MFVLHPSAALREHFSRKPYQGAEPGAAQFLFVGLDANYAADIEHRPIFAKLLSYHADGPTFWRSTGVHHPFLLPEYSGRRGDGRRYHGRFAKIGFRPEDAHRVSFIELLHLPTVGQSKLVPPDLDPQHLRRLREAMFAGARKYVFVSDSVRRLMQASGHFPELKPAATRSGDHPLPVLHADPGCTVYQHLHLSNYGKFELQLQQEAQAIRALLAA